MNRCVLVVEDEPLIRMQTVAMLEAAGLRVADFDSADEALVRLTENPGDVAAVFTDINLVGTMTGVDLASRVASEHPGIALIVTSGRFTSLPAGLPEGSVFLPKPWLPLQVIKAMQDAVYV